jgi:hypothetical protein
MKVGIKIVAWVYGLQTFLVLPWFLGAIYRQEQSLWAWEEYARAVQRHGQGDALFSIYLYGIFYSAFFVIPYLALSLWFAEASADVKRYSFIGRVMLSCWFAVTFFLFAEPVFAFIHTLPSEVWNGWLLILWGAVTVFVILLFRQLWKLQAKHTGDTQED